MNRHPLLIALRYALVVVMLAWVPDIVLAQMNCVDCHQIHDSPGGTLNTAEEFDVICDTCHGPAGTAVFADRHIDPNARYQNDPGGTVQPAWVMTCVTCHAPHEDESYNHLYNNGTPHVHSLGGDAGNLVIGRNIKLFGRDEDHTGVAKVALPVKILGVVTNSPLCPNSATDLRVSLPTFAAGQGPLHTIMAGDRITITNADAEYNGVWRVKETAWDVFQATAGQGMVCFDGPDGSGGPPPFLVTNATYDARRGLAVVTLDRAHPYARNEAFTVSGIVSTGPGEYNGTFTVGRVPAANQIEYSLGTNPGTYVSGGSIPDPGGASPVTNAYMQSRGWHERPRLTNATWAGGIAELTLRDVYSLRPGDTAVLSGVTSGGPGSFNGSHTVAAVTSTRVLGAGWASGTATLTLAENHLYQVGDQVVVKDIISGGPGTFNGWFTVSGVSGASVSYALPTDPGAYASSHGTVDMPYGYSKISYALGTDPGVATDLLPARIEYVGSIKAVQSMSITGATTMNITLASAAAGAGAFRAATSGVRDGDIVTLFGAEPAGYNGRWEITAVSLPTISVRCPPYSRTALQLPACTLNGVGAYVGGGDIQSTGSMRPVVFESRATDNTDPDFLSDYTHGFTNTDLDEDGWMDGPCEVCHTQTANHKNDDFGNTHNNNRTCTDGCHSHSVGFDKSNDFCPAGRTCPPTN